MEVEPGLFEPDENLDIDSGATVYVLDSTAGRIVGPFEYSGKSVGLPGQDTDQHRIRVRPAAEELNCIEDDDIVAQAEGPRLERPLTKAIEYANPPRTVASETFLGDGTEPRDSETSDSDDSPRGSETNSDTVSGSESQFPTLETVFTEQTSAENVDFAGEEVTGAKTLRDVSLRRCSLSDTSLRDVTFRNVNLRDVDFRGADLRDATFVGRGTQLGGADFTDARLDGVTFEVDVSHCLFTGAQLREADFRKATLEGADFSGARLKRAKFNGTEPERATFDRAVLQDVKTRGARFEKASFVDADLYNTTFTETTLVDVDFSGADLREATFRECTLSDVDFEAAKLVKATLSDHDTDNLDFSRADLTDATLTDSAFTGARFTEALLTRAELRRCDCRGVSMADVRADRADFTGANLEYATLAQADLTEATFTDARLYTCQMAAVRVGTETTLEGTHDYLDAENDGGWEARDDDTDEDPPARKAASVYRTLESVYRDNSLTDESLQYHRLRKDANIRANREAGRVVPALYDGFLKVTTSHGTRLRPLFLWAVGLVFSAAALHLTFGTLEHSTLGPVGFGTGSLGVPTAISQAVLFSALSFTGLGYGRFTPVGALGEVLAVAQTGFGILFFGLLVFVLSTRASR